MVGRREALGLLATASAATVIGCRTTRSRSERNPIAAPLPAGAILELEPLGSPPWATRDPFLFCVHHVDDYPRGNELLGPAASLDGRTLGRDFADIDGWNMYHGRLVPGFPRHPHRGFETVTVVQEGLLDHSDSLGATARYGQGDVQWLTAGAGIQHAEMFPLIAEAQPNPLRFFQIWLNLPARKKLVEPHFSMLWQPTIPRRGIVDDRGRRTELHIVAGAYEGMVPPSPPPQSWATEPEAAERLSTADALRLEAALQTPLLGSPNQLEVVQANLEEREPRFRDPQ